MRHCGYGKKLSGSCLKVIIGKSRVVQHPGTKRHYIITMFNNLGVNLKCFQIKYLTAPRALVYSRQTLSSNTKFALYTRDN